MDRKCPASTDAPALDGEDDGQSLASILEDAERRASAKGGADQMADEIAALYPVAKPDETCLLFFDNPVEQVSEWIRNGTSRELGFRPAWVRIAKTNLGRGGIFTVSNPTADGEAELIAISQRNVLTRRVLAEVASWAFQILGLTRLVVRIPADRADLSAMALKAGFRHEGTARRYFHGAVDAQIWAMCAAECKWLPKLPPLIPPDVSPPFSHRMH